MSPFGVDLQTTSFGLLLLRVVFGSVMTAHGAQKLLGWFGGYGLSKTGEFFVQLGFWQGRALASIASLTEMVSGTLVVLGFLGPIGPALMVSVMIVAMIRVHWQNGLFAAKNGVELPLLFATTAIGLALIGFGRYSVDAVLGISGRWSTAVTLIIVSTGLAGGLVSAAIRRRSATAPE